MKSQKLGLIAKVVGLVLTLSIVIAAYAQERKQAAFLTISDPAAAEKILEVLKQQNPEGYVFTGKRKDSNGRGVNFSQGKLSLTQVRLDAKKVGVKLPGGSNAWVHEKVTVKNFVAKNSLDKIREILNTVDKKLYKLEVVQVQ